MNVYFDSGSPRTFISTDIAQKLGGIMELPEPRNFEGLGDGKFSSKSMTQLWFNLAGIWCSHPAYVVDRRVIEEDILAGHDFTQEYNIKLDTKRREIILDKNSLRRAQKIR